MDTFVRSRPIYTGGSGHRPAWRHLVGRRGGSPAIGSCARSRDGRLQPVDPSERIARVVESSMLGKCVQSELRATPKRTPNPDGCELPQVQLSNRSPNIQTVPNSDGSDCGPPQPASDNQHSSTRVFPFGSGSESDCGELRRTVRRETLRFARSRYDAATSDDSREIRAELLPASRCASSINGG